ncbi:MAG: type II toxin-antitoxin system RelE/ParE family toxin [Sulfuritalea sp.]|nr:type II toxin-antitoxin system RelE/ParE family toxin [Sulfuritalea sp.]
MSLVWHPLAIDDRERIMDFIARDKPFAALALDEDFEAHAERLTVNPLLYKPGRMAGTREIVARPNYVMVYRVEGWSTANLYIETLAATASKAGFRNQRSSWSAACARREVLSFNWPRNLKPCWR